MIEIELLGAAARALGYAGSVAVAGAMLFAVSFARAAEAVASELRSLLGSPLDRGDVERARKLVKADGAIEDSLVLARAYCDDALRALEPVAGRNEAADALAAATTGLLDTVPAL